jgi:hypothetical protein
MDTVCELLRLGEVGQLRLHPYHVAVGRVGDGAVDGGFAATLVPVVALSRSGSFPVEVDIDTCQALCNGTSLGVALALALLQELLDEILLVHVYTGIDRVNDSLVVKLQVGLLRPCVLDRLELCTILSSLLSSVHELAERLECRVCTAHDVVVIAWVNGRSDEGSGF